jgi:hypothetical protein
MFCKVCKDSGKTEPEYTSHFVKDKSGEVRCPTLLNQECKYCKQTGHTVKFCKTLKLKEKEMRRELYLIKQRQEELKQQIARPIVNLFATDSEDESEDDSEDEPEQIVNIDLKENVPISMNFIRSYASVVAKSEDKEAQEVKKVSPSFVLDTSRLKGKSWALDDSDDSDEE